MPRFRYAAVDKEGQVHKGTLEASDQGAALNTLSSHYEMVTTLKEAGAGGLAMMVRRFLGQRVKTEDLLGFTQELAAVVGAGVTLKAGLDLLSEDTHNPKLQQIVEKVSRHVEGGGTLSEAMREHPEAFPRYYSSLVAAGETSGTLAVVLDRLAHQIENSEILAAKVRGAFYYPGIILAFSALLSFVIMTVGMPMLEGIYSSLGGTLPWPTRFMISISHLLGKTWFLWALVVPGGIWFIVKTLNTDKGSLWFDRWKLSLPVLGELFRHLAIARFARNFSTVFSAGLGMIDSLELISTTTGSRVLEQAVKEAIEPITQGQGLSQCLRASGFFTPLTLGLLRSGEATGTMDVMLTKIADFYETRVELALKALSSLVEPILMIFVGIALGGLIVCMGLPFLNLSAAF
ncbi:MAG: fimbrial assembly protein PilC [Candidatus Xenobia bacterium]|jgi:type IV pilus assembly protein PilC